MRQVLSTAITAVIVSLLTLTAAGALAQDAPTTERTISPAAVSNINADRVDGKHAVGFTNKRAGRAGHKLVATNKQGLLPSNIVKPLWGAIKDKPAGFADGIDNEGVSGVTLVTTSDYRTLEASASSGYVLHCPAGNATGGGFLNVAASTRVLGSLPYGDHYYLELENTIATPDSFDLYVTCLTTEGGVAVASRLTQAAKAARPGK